MCEVEHYKDFLLYITNMYTGPGNKNSDDEICVFLQSFNEIVFCDHFTKIAVIPMVLLMKLIYP